MTLPPPLPRDWDPPWGPLRFVTPYQRDERRLIPRHQILMVGKITLARGLSVDCTVRNLAAAHNEKIAQLRATSNPPQSIHADNDIIDGQLSVDDRAMAQVQSRIGEFDGSRDGRPSGLQLSGRTPFRCGPQFRECGLVGALHTHVDGELRDR